MQESGPAAQSTFVTVLAWIFIIFGGFGVVGALIQNVMINVMFPAVAKMPATYDQPIPAFPIGVFRLFGVIVLAFACFALYAAIALLKRRNWARVTFVVLLGCGIVFNLLWAVMFGFGVGFAHVPSSQENAVPPEFQTMFVGMAVAFGVFALAMSVLYGWLIGRLCSVSIKAEFTRATVAT